MEYGSEVVSLVSKTSLNKYDIQNSALRTITGGAKSTPITAMELQTGEERLESHRDKSTSKFWERSKRIDGKYWNSCNPALENASQSVTHAVKLMEKYQIPTEQIGTSSKLFNSRNSPTKHQVKPPEPESKKN